MINKIAGGLLFFLGLLIVVKFPFAHPTYQPFEMQRAGVLFGIILMIIGLVLLWL